MRHFFIVWTLVAVSTAATVQVITLFWNNFLYNIWILYTINASPIEWNWSFFRTSQHSQGEQNLNAEADTPVVLDVARLLELTLKRTDSIHECKKVYKSEWASTLMKIYLNLGMWMLKFKANGLFSNCKEFLKTSAEIEVERGSLLPEELNTVENRNVKFQNLNSNLMKQSYKSVVTHAADATNEKIHENKLSGAKNAMHNFVEMICEYCHNGQFKPKVSN